MGYPKEHKSKTRQKIIESAYRLFTAKGYAATSIDEIMRGGGLTRGGFYAHFKSKSQLYREAIGYAAAKVEMLESWKDKQDESAWVTQLLEQCMGAEPGEGNARLGFFARDVASRDAQVRSAYTAAFKTICAKLLSRSAAQQPVEEDSVLSLAAMIIGTVSIAQTTDDSALTGRLLHACRETAQALFEHNRHCASPTFFWAGATTKRDRAAFT